MYILLFSFLIVTISSIFLFIESDKEKQFLVHSINDKIWKIDSIRWPSEVRGVYTYFSSNNVDFFCQEVGLIAKEFFLDKNESVDFGQKCSRLVVFVNFKELNSVENFKEFAAAHESFHLAAQIYGMPFAFMVDYKFEEDYYFVDEFSKLLISTMNNKSKTCSNINNYLDDLSDNKRLTILFKAMYEWPAEYYAKRFVFGSDTESYYQFKGDVTNKINVRGKQAWNDFYSLSILLADNIERKIEKQEWQNRVNKGESMLDVYLKLNKCRSYSDSWLKGNVNIYKLRLDNKKF